VTGLLWLIVAIPLASALVLAVLGSHFTHRVVTALGVGSIGVSAVMTMLVAAEFVSAPPAGKAYTEVLWAWINVAGFQPTIGFYLDALSLVMILVVTFVGFWIHLYSA
jgi:NADH-quinone oxidoreductase subunit L